MSTLRVKGLVSILTVGLLFGGSFLACGGSGESSGPTGSKAKQAARGPGRGFTRGMGDDHGSSQAAAVPVEVVRVTRRAISSFLETNGTLEAENEVDVVARVAGPIVELAAEEGMVVKRGQLLAHIDEREPKAQVDLARVALAEATRGHERAKAARENDIISEEVYDQALTQLESAQAQLENAQIKLDYTRIRAPFTGIIVERSIKLADNVTVNQKLFRISDFDPLLCKIQVPEKQLAGLKIGQPAQITVEAWPEERFEARVLRISPVVDAATGTIRVTLQVNVRGGLRPGMFASVFLVMDRHAKALVIPKAALSYESLGDTVYVAREGLAERRNLKLGFEEKDFVEVLEGLQENERVIVVGQDGLSDGTPVHILAGPGAGEEPAPRRAAGGGVPTAGETMGGRGPSGAPGAARRRMDFSKLTPEQLERVKQRMRARGMSDEQIEEVIRHRREESKKQ